MHILVTGANGFVGSNLVKALLELQHELSNFSRLSLLDLQFQERSADPRVAYYQGDFSDTALIEQALAQSVDVVFHLASIPGGMAEQNYELSRKVNVDAMLFLFEQLKQQGNCPRVVFASTIAVYGSDLPEQVDDDTPLKPHLTYAGQKQFGEIVLDDFSRKGWIDGVAVRLPGIVARPQQPSGLLSAFMSDVFWTLSQQRTFACPVSQHAVAWWMSVKCCVDNLIHAASLPKEQLQQDRRVFTLPVLRLSMQQVVDGLAQEFTLNTDTLVSFDSNNPQLEKNFGAYPEIHTRRADALGFKHDGSIQHLIKNTLNLD
ncbi:NAD-dependent epimerase/dehydratase family protein [Acinetobacter nosocomialis]|uniref:NAD-dependent epimerase/dehydratase family protein n=1 Tax=Acinetobacter nosocomialis TaxID=106654 RepID=UPI0012506E04|nr:NAD-dependent epimerase/dehydratase family protein [Acinetobacter nosocomialis]